MDKLTLLRIIGKNVAIQRVIKDVSQRELARMCDRPVSIINKIERGKTNPTLSTLNEISVALNINIKELFKKIDLVET